MVEITRQVINVLYIAAEAEPFARVGGLGDVAGALPLALRAIPIELNSHARLDVRLAIPYYARIKSAGYHTQLVTEFDIQTRKSPVHALVYETKSGDLPVYLIDGQPIQSVDGIYGTSVQADAEKFIFFSLACLRLPEEIGWHVDILHANDWHTAAAIHQMKRLRRANPFYKQTKSTISIHNLPFMGTGAKEALRLYQISPARNPSMPPWSRSLPLPMGIDAADWVLTVSPHYAEEILTSGFGCDLQEYLKTRAGRLTGILNGLDTDLWDPANDRNIKQPFDANSLSARWSDKKELQSELNLPQDVSIPILAYVGRMEDQKGVDLILQAISKLKPDGWQCVILGTGNKKIEAAALALQAAQPGNIRVLTKFDIPLSHRIYAGADMLMMPSRYEPCGLAQMIAMRYGCIPVASATGGLVNTIFDHTVHEIGTGFLFDLGQKDGLYKAIVKALKIFKNQTEWQQIQINAMHQDHSWKNSALEYAALYRKLLRS